MANEFIIKHSDCSEGVILINTDLNNAITDVILFKPN